MPDDCSLGGLSFPPLSHLSKGCGAPVVGFLLSFWGYAVPVLVLRSSCLGFLPDWGCSLALGAGYLQALVCHALLSPAGYPEGPAMV